MSFLTISAAVDGFPLVATIFEPRSTTPNKTVIIACATGISQAFYAPFANFLADHGHRVLTFDYRFNGLSFNDKEACFTLLDENERIRILKDNAHVSLHEFGEKDIRGVLEHAAEIYGSPIYYSMKQVDGADESRTFCRMSRPTFSRLTCIVEYQSNSVRVCHKSIYRSLCHQRSR